MTTQDPSTTRAIARLLRHAERRQAPASFVAMLWKLRAAPHEVQIKRLEQLAGALSQAHRTAVAQGR